MANLREQRARWAIQVERARTLPRIAYAQAVNSWRQRWARNAAAEYKRSNSIETLSIFSAGSRSQLVETSRKNNQRLIVVGRDFETAFIKARGVPAGRQARGLIWVQREDGGDEELSIRLDYTPQEMQLVRRFLDERSVGLWGKVSQTIKQELADVVAQGIKDGLSLDKRAILIQQKLGNSQSDAQRIAWTESTAAMNHGQWTARIAADISHKEWVSVIDRRTREGEFNHVLPDGQTVENTKPFLVSGQRLLYPGDSSQGASAGNVIRCRCTAVAAFPDEDTSTTVAVPAGVPAPRPTQEEQAALDAKPWRKKAPLRIDLRVVSQRRGPTEEIGHPITEERVKEVQDRLRIAHDGLEKLRAGVAKFADDQKEVEALQVAEDATRVRQAMVAKLHNITNDLTKREGYKEQFKTLEKEAKSIERKKEAKAKALRDKVADALALDPKDRQPIELKMLSGKKPFGQAKEAADWMGKMLGKVHAENPMHKGPTFRFVVKGGNRGREYYSMGTVVGSRSTEGSVWAHELAHGLEKLGEVQELTKGYLHARVGKENPEFFKTLFPRGKWGPSEVGREDRWQWMIDVTGNKAQSWYTGKHYDNATEVLSVGVEMLYRAPATFAEKDPEFFRFIVGVLRGDLI